MTQHAPGSIERLVADHLAASASGDIDALLDDYDESAVLITPGGITSGKPAIRQAFEDLFKDSLPTLILRNELYSQNVGYITWFMDEGKASELHGSDTFVIRDGKIVVQTVALFSRQPAA
jgi:ketosteroid isomerase-like protein